MKEYLSNIMKALASILSKQEFDEALVDPLEDSLLKITEIVEALDDSATSDQVADILDQLSELFDQLAKSMQRIAKDDNETLQALEKAKAALQSAK